eukprot:313386_1
MINLIQLCAHIKSSNIDKIAININDEIFAKILETDQFQQEEEETFWMSKEDYFTNFKSICLCYLTSYRNINNDNDNDNDNKENIDNETNNVIVNLRRCE